MAGTQNDQAKAQKSQTVPLMPRGNSVRAVVIIWATIAIAQFVIGILAVRGASTDPISPVWIFGMIAFLLATMFLGGWWVWIEKHQERALARQYPYESWKWRPEWVSGIIRDNSALRAAVGWIITILLTVLMLPMAIAGINESIAKGKAVSLSSIFLLLFNLPLFVVALYVTAQWRKFGRSVFRSDAFPFSPGGDVVGTIRVPARFASADGVNLRLVCVNIRLSGTGRGSRVVETVRWELKRRVMASPVYKGSGLDVPVRFALPDDVPVTRSIGPNNDDHWFLDATASVPGIDYVARFEVPVFVVPHV